MLCSCSRLRFGIPAQKKLRVVRFDHWGAPKAFGGSNLAKSNEPLCRPPAPAGSANRRVDHFHRLFMYSRLRVCPVSACDFGCKSLSSWEKRLRIFFKLNHSSGGSE
jgi:hypothetical protein